MRIHRGLTGRDSPRMSDALWIRRTLPLFLGLLHFWCSPLVSLLAYHPDRKFQINNEQLPPAVRRLFIATPDRIRLECFYVENRSSSNLLIYFHGNAGNISHRVPELVQITGMGVNVLGVGYRGYGRSTGRVSEAGTYADGESALRYASDSLGFPHSRIFLLGRSIGTTVAVNASMHKSIRGLILVTPLTTGSDYAISQGLGFIRFLAGSSFDNMGKLGNLSCPVLILHGTDDEVIPYWMGTTVYDSIRNEKLFVRIDGGHHNDLEYIDPRKYWGAVFTFLTRTTVP